jgi:uncharacterized protein YndB with AHSA1/START domain
MRTLQTSVHVDAPPEVVWEWLLDLADHYVDWHPEHVCARWIHGEPNEVGAVLSTVEYIARHREVTEFELTELDPPRRYAYRIVGRVRMLLPAGAFEIAPEAGGSRFTATISYRFGPLTELLFRKRTAALRDHMLEEGENLKRLIEEAA